MTAFDPRSLEPRIPGVLQALRDGRPESALGEIDALLAAGNAPSGVQYYRGLAYSDMGRPEDALLAFEAELLANPGNGRAHGMLADVLLELGRLAEAQVHIDQGRGLATDFPYLVLVTGRAAAMADNAPLARNAFETYLQTDSWGPLAAEAHHMLYQLALARDDKQAARDHLERSDHLERIQQYLNRFRERLADDPEDTDAALGVAKIYLDLYRTVKQDGAFLDQAEGGLQRVLAARTEDVPALFNMGFVRMVQGRNDEALQYYGAAVALDPTHVGAHLNSGMLLRAVGRPEDALGPLETAVQLTEIGGERERALYEQARCLETLGLTEQAAQSYRELLALPPQGRWDAAQRLQAIKNG